MNLSNPSTLGRINENIQQGGGQPYSPTRVQQAEGGFLNLRKVADSVTTSEPVPPSGEEPSVPQSDFIIDKSRPTKYTAKVGEGSVLVEQGALYQIGLSDSMGPSAPKPYQKTRLKSAREQAEDITRGESEPFFIGYKNRPAIAREEQALLEQGVEGEVFPITYTTEEGKPLVVITGKSEGTEFSIYQPGKAISVTLTPTEELRQQPSKPESPSKGIERELKAAGKPLYAAAVETFAPLITKPLRLMGKEEEADKIVKQLNPSYEKYVQPPPGPTVLENVIETGQLTTGRGLASDIAGYGTSGLLIAAGVPSIRLTKLKLLLQSVKSLFIKEPKPTVREPLAEYTPGRYPVSRFPSALPEGELVEFKTQRISLGKGLTKQPSIQATAPIKTVEAEKGYAPQRLPVSRFPETYGISKTGYEETRISLGRGIIKTPQKQFRETRLQLGKGEIKRPGKDFTKETLGLGAGTVKTPPRVLGKTEGPPQPVKKELGYAPQRLPVSIFPETYGISKTGYEETRISLGRGIIKFPKEGGTTVKRFTIPKPPTKPTKEIETKISKGLLLLMEKPLERKTFTSTKIDLGTSDKILQIRGGKVISDTLTKRKAKTPSETFFIPSSGASITEETKRYPPSAKLTSPTLSLLGTSKEQTKISQLITQKIEVKQPSKLKTEVTASTIQKPRTRLEVTPRLTTKEKQKERYGFPPYFPTRQTPSLKQPQREIPKQPQKLIEVPKEPPPKLILAFPPTPKPRPKRKAEPKEPKSAFEWKGGVPEFKIEGIYKKYDIIYGEKRIAKLLKEERFGKPKRKAKKQYDVLGFPKTKKAKSSKWAF